MAIASEYLHNLCPKAVRLLRPDGRSIVAGALICCVWAGPARADVPNVSAASVTESLSSTEVLPAPQPVRSVTVEVRTIRATDGGALGPHESQGRVIAVDTRIRDLATRLSKLHFRTFNLIDSHLEVVSLMKKQAIPLSQGAVLVLRPMYVQKDRVGMWLKWKDAQKATVLDSRMHFNMDEPMLVGVDGDDQSGLILVVNVSPTAE